MATNITPDNRDAYAARRDQGGSGWLWGLLAAIAVLVVLGIVLWGMWDTQAVEGPVVETPVVEPEAVRAAERVPAD